jgi:hypothetical protein
VAVRARRDAIRQILELENPRIGLIRVDSFDSVLVDERQRMD